MKKFLFTVCGVSLLAFTAFAQTKPAAASTGAASSGGTGAEGRVAIINSSAFNSEIGELKVKIDALGAEIEPKRKEIEGINKQIEDIKAKLQQQGGTVNEATRNQWIEQGQELDKVLKRKTEDYESLVQKRGGEMTGPVYQKIQEALNKYATARGIALVIDGVAAQNNGLLLYAVQTTDITTDFIKEYNKSNPAPAGSAAPSGPAKKP